MSSFLDPLVLEDLGDRTFKVVSPFRYHVGDSDEEIITVPSGFLTDFASVPRIFWAVLPPYGPYGKAAVIHDALYQNKGFGKYSRKRSDEIFLEGMDCLGVDWVTRHTMFRAVRLFAWRVWGKTRTERKQKIAERLDVPLQSVAESPKPHIVK